MAFQVSADPAAPSIPPALQFCKLPLSSGLNTQLHTYSLIAGNKLSFN